METDPIVFPAFLPELCFHEVRLWCFLFACLGGWPVRKGSCFFDLVFDDHGCQILLLGISCFIEKSAGSFERFLAVEFMESDLTDGGEARLFAIVADCNGVPGAIAFVLLP